MAFVPGQVLLLKIRFAKGTVSKLARLLLIIEVTDNQIFALNVSTVQGKEHKLLFPSTCNIRKFNPPFDHASFVSFNELYAIELFDSFHPRVLGQTVDVNELRTIQEAFDEYKKKYIVTIVTQTSNEIQHYNSKQ